MGMLRKNILAIIITILVSCFITSDAKSAVLFTDTFINDFNSQTNSVWGSETGTWLAEGGVYKTSTPSCMPQTYSSITSLPNLTDFTVNVDINSLNDGGIFLRSQDNLHGILLVTGGMIDGLYWHIVNDSYYPRTGDLYIAGFKGSNSHITIDVKGNTYTAYVNNNKELSTTLVDNTYTSGKVALYSNSSQTFDNIVISDNSPTPTPEPSTLILGFMSLSGLFGLKRRK